MERLLHGLDWVLPLRSPWATTVAHGFSVLGYAPFFLVFLPLAYWLWDRDGATTLALLICLTGALNAWLKDFWQDPRPDPRYAIDPFLDPSYGRPSGHAQVSSAMWLWLAHKVQRPWAWPAALLIIAGVSFSRMYLGVHDLDDVLTGLALGSATVIVFLWAARPEVDLARRIPPPARFLLVAALVPIAWWTWPIATGPGRTLGALYLLLGWMAGAFLDRRLAPQAPRRPVAWKQATIVALGLAAVLALRVGLVAFGAWLGLGEVAAGNVAASALGFFMTCVAPLGFRALGLLG